MVDSTHICSVVCSERFFHHGGSEKRLGAVKHALLCGISLRIFLDGSNPLKTAIENSISPKNMLHRTSNIGQKLPEMGPDGRLRAHTLGK